MFKNEPGTLNPQPSNSKLLYDKAAENLESFRRELKVLTDELDHLPEQIRDKATQLLDIAKSQLLQLEKEWNTLRQQRSTSEEPLQTFIAQIARYREDISILVRRRIHRANLGMLEKQLALGQSALTQAQLDATLRPQMDFEREKIRLLEEKKRPTASEQEILAIHRNNLQIYQEMLSGQRPFAPLHLVNSVTMEEQAIQAIDKSISV